MRQSVLAILNMANKDPSAAELLRSPEASQVHQAVALMLRSRWDMWPMSWSIEKTVSGSSHLPGPDRRQRRRGGHIEFCCQRWPRGRTVSASVHVLPLVDEFGVSSPDVLAMYGARSSRRSQSRSWSQ